MNWHGVNIFVIPTRDSEEFFFQVTLPWISYEGRGFLIAPTPCFLSIVLLLALLRIVIVSSSVSLS